MGTKKPGTTSNNTKPNKKSYPGFSSINGTHPLRKAVPDAVVDYSVRTRHGGEVFYFNFNLAKEMGLIPKNHPQVLNKELSNTILRTFSIQIINEYDVINKTPIPKKNIRSNQYMATRYLQLQHPDKKGLTSGDGRSIWNGFYKSKNTMWDISSVGTGVTRLCPATAIENKYFKTGDKYASYGSGRSDLLDGVCTAVMSDVLHRNDIPTERTLAIIAYKDGTSINVRSQKNLLRPAHIFRCLKQNDYSSLKNIIDYHIKRQVSNQSWPNKKSLKQRYQYLVERIASDFARAAALYESEYIFCWMDWDGDNILTNGGIIDYGSLRQFGLFHHEYRYDDVDRMSTTITEQKNKARYIVQTFAQITDYLITGKKKPITSFKNHKSVKLFNTTYEQHKVTCLLRKIGFKPDTIELMSNDKSTMKLVREFQKSFSYFERAKSKKGLYAVSDGVTWDAIFCMRDILRELPEYYLDGNLSISADEFIEIARSNYATNMDSKLTPSRKKRITEFLALYNKIFEKAAQLRKTPATSVLREITTRSALINRYDRITGDSIIHIANRLIKAGKKVSSKEFYAMYEDFVEAQVLLPEYFPRGTKTNKRHKTANAKKAYHSMLDVVREHREGI